MENALNLIGYFNGIIAYYNYLCGNIGAKDANMDAIRYLGHIRGAKVSLIALFFETKKEDMIEEVSISDDKKDYISKVDDEALVSMINILATKQNDVYKLGSYESTNPYELVAFIRHSFAHGRYSVDTKNNKIIINNRGHVIDLNIDDVCMFIYGACRQTIKFPKTKHETRYECRNEKEFKQITNKEELKVMLKTSWYIEHNLTSMNNLNINKNVLDIFNELYVYRTTNPTDEVGINNTTDRFKKYALSEKVSYMISKKRLKDDELEAMADYIDNCAGFYEFPIEMQRQFVLRQIGNKFAPNTHKDWYLSGIMYNLMVLEDMGRYNEFDLSKITSTKAINLNNSVVECVLSGILAAFNAMYIYPLETMYTDELKYSRDRKDEFDFGSLDLSFINPTILNISDKPLKKQQELISSLNKKREKLELEKDAIEKNLERAKEHNNTSGVEKLTELLEYKDFLIDIAYSDFLDEVDTYLRIEDDLEDGHKYHRNKAIIVGLRNAIAHGNVIVKKFVGETDIDDSVILFQDIYEGKVTFEVEMTIKDIERLINLKTIDPLITYLEDKYGVEEPVVEEVKEPVVEERKEEKGFQKVLKRIFKNKKSND